ncbi:hypothetical protein ACLFMI_14755 [Pseudonocardia nantongensis]|uniref:hypothetical protein n=1 Tax=Pseudonocardia nantongensis TaxID=1181885 RepID=UPI00397C0283
MGFLARRTSTPPAPATPATPPATVSPTPSRINWQHDRPVGWTALPEPARRALAAAGWADTAPMAAYAYAPTTRRDAGGRFWRDTDAWWIDQATLLTVRAREALIPLGMGADARPRLGVQPGGGGRVRVAAHPLSGPPPTGQRWRRPQSTDPVCGHGEVRLTDAAIEILPRAVQDEIGRPTGQGGIRSYPPHGGYYDRVYAYRRVAPTELLVLAAVRECGAYPDPDTAIDAADWHITTYRPQVGAPSESTLAM